MNEKTVIQILALALMAGLKSGARIASTAGVKKALIVGSIMAAITVADAAYNIYTTLLTPEQVSAFNAECSKLENHVVISHMDETKTSVLKLECQVNSGQPTVIIESTGLKALLLNNFNTVFAG